MLNWNMIILYQSQIVWAGMNDLLEHGCLKITQTVLYSLTNLLTLAGLCQKWLIVSEVRGSLYYCLNWPLICLKLNYYSIHIR